MNRVYVVEFLGKGHNKIVSWFTGLKFVHTGMIVEISKELFFCDLRLRLKNQIDYKIEKMSDYYKPYNWFRLQEHEVKIFEVPQYFGTQQVKKTLAWWQERIDKNIKYDVGKLASMASTKWILKLARWYYRKTGKPYQLKYDTERDVCSIAVDECLRETLNYDVFPEYSERVIPPGMFAKRLKYSEVKE